MVDEHLQLMIHQLTTFNDPSEHKYVVTKDGLIGYSYQDTILTSISSQYETLWAYMYETTEKSTISTEDCDRQFGLRIYCGRFSYGEIPHTYEIKVGATGTFSCISEFEKEVVTGKKPGYGIEHWTDIPSIYGDKSARLDFKANSTDPPHVYVESDRPLYWRKLQEEVIGARSKSRPCLIYFETEKVLKSHICPPC
jgi:hypothetical protein